MATSGRVDAVDLLRGLVIVLMALDHARDFFGLTNFDPADLGRASPELFLTRWITHFCAPVFVFLAGTSAALAARSLPTRELARSLVRRGAWLILLEFTIVRAGWFIGFAADVTFRFAFVQVIWALGWSMIILGALVFLPRALMFTLALAVVLLHNTLDRLDPASFGPFEALWKLLHVSTAIHWSISDAAPPHTLFVRYPLLPWPAVMALGYLFAPVLALPARARNSLCLRLGAGLSLAFILLRASNLYGDPNPWRLQPTLFSSILHFINCEKYPASLCYLLMTLGPAILALPFLERLPLTIRNPLLVFGRTPMFFYIAHLYLLQFGAIVTAFARYGSAIFEWSTPPDDFSLGLPAVYAAWAIAVTTLYFPCRWFAKRKQTIPPRWRWLL